MRALHTHTHTHKQTKCERRIPYGLYTDCLKFQVHIFLNILMKLKKYTSNSVLKLAHSNSKKKKKKEKIKD